MTIFSDYKKMNDNKKNEIKYWPLTILAASFFMSACSNNSFNNSSTDVYKESDRYTPMERVETGNSDNSFLALAHEMAAQGDHAAAIPLYRRANGWSSSVDALVGLGDSLSAIGQYNEAIEVFQKAVSSDGNNSKALKGLGASYLAVNRPTRAIPFLQQATRVNSRDVEAMSALALALDMQGHREASLEIYRDGLAVDPDNLKLLNNYGLSLALQSRHEQAIEVLKQAAQHKDAGATHRQNLAMAYALSGNEPMSARLLSIDSGPELTNENLNYFRVLTALPTEDRFNSILNQSGNDKTDITDAGNEVFNNDDSQLTDAITVARLVEVQPEPMVEVTPEPEPVVQMAEEDNGVPALLGPEGWALQIAAYRTKEELRPGWEKLKKKYFDIIGMLEPRRSEIDFGDRDTQPNGYYYRLNAGPLTSYEEARIACKQIKELGTDCWVRPPEVAEGDLPESAKDKELAEKYKYREELPPQKEDGV